MRRHDVDRAGRRSKHQPSAPEAGQARFAFSSKTLVIAIEMAKHDIQALPMP